MEVMDKLEIPLSKKKILLAIAGSILFVIAGIYFMTTMADQQDRFNPTLVKTVGVASVLFFGATAVYGMRKLFDTRAGLIIDSDGIVDNTNASSIGLIPWEDITHVTIGEVASTKFLLIFTKEPERILEKVSGFKRRILAANKNMYGTPISITSTTLQYKFSDLEKLLKERLQQHRETAGPGRLIQ